MKVSLPCPALPCTVHLVRADDQLLSLRRLLRALQRSPRSRAEVGGGEEHPAGDGTGGMGGRRGTRGGRGGGGGQKTVRSFSPWPPMSVATTECQAARMQEQGSALA